VNIPIARARKAACNFSTYGDFRGIEPFGTGHINASFAFTMDQGGKEVRYFLQCINTYVFRDPEGLMRNIVRVTRHIRDKLIAEGRIDSSRRVLTVVPALDGAPIWRDEEGGFWRCYVFIEGAHSSDLMDSPDRARALGTAVGRFQSLLSDLPGPRLVETIPAFHDARKRYAAFERSIAEDSAARAASVKKEIDFFRKNRIGFDRIVAALESGAIPERITHNDTKMNNLLLDDETGEAICLIDLDTVMPGSSVYDFGDLARTVPVSATEDDPTPSRMELVLPIYKSLVEGYAEGATTLLTQAERDLLPWGARIITMLIGIRFLTDYLEGDIYYHVLHTSQNLDRCRTQIALIESFDRNWTAVLEITGAAFKGKAAVP
jgi:Ser/Thr protein kinase RdoA (MazF antagonist)